MAIFEQTTCPFCSLHCGDLRLEITGGRLSSLSPGCHKAMAGYQYALDDISPTPNPEKTPGDLQNDLFIAASWLKEARQPLVILSMDIDQQAARMAVSLARKLDAFLCLEGGNSRISLSLGMNSAGLLSGTLGELRGRQILLCHITPEEQLPRFWEFLSPDQEKNAWRIDNEAPVDDVRRLRLALRPGRQHPAYSLAGLAEKITAVHAGVVLFGEDWLNDGTPPAAELLVWLNELNKKGKWYGFPVFPEPNGVGVVETLLSETGYPGCIRFAGGQAEFVHYELQLEQFKRSLLSDVILLVGRLKHPHLSTITKKAPRIIMISPESPEEPCDLWISSAQSGVDGAGEMLRLDGIPMQLQPVVSSGRPPAAEILRKMIDGVAP